MRNRAKYLLLAFLLPMFIQCVVYILLGFFPFGDKSILVWDMDWQYVSFLSWLSRTLKEKSIDSIFYSFSISFGSSTMGLLGYYLLSPFNILLLLFDTANLPCGIFLITILKLSSCGLTMYLYLSEYNGQCDNKNLLLFSTSYALMGYNITQQQNLMWIDAVILLPLITLGIYRFITRKKIVLFVVSMAMAIIVNFYTGYMLCLFAGIYLLLEILLRKERIIIREILTDYIKGLGCIVLAVLLSSISLFPVCYEISGGRLQGTSLKDTIVSLFIMDERMWELPGKLCLGAYNVHQLKNGLPNIYTGGLCILLLGQYFFGRGIRENVKNKILYGIACGIFFLSMISVGFTRIWHGFSEVHGSPFRYIFLFSFLTISIACKCFVYWGSKGEEVTRGKRKIIKYVIRILILVYLSYKAYTQYLEDNSDYLSILQIMLTVFFLIAWILILKNYKSINMWIMFLVLSLELGINMAMIFNNFSYTNYNEYAEYINNMNLTLEQIYSENNEDLYRVENDIRYGDQRCYNDAMLLGYSSVTHYSSILPYVISDFASTLGMSEQPGSVHVAYKADSIDTQTAGKIGIKYFITEKIPENVIDWEIIKEKPYYVLKNLYYRSIIQFDRESEADNVQIEKIENAKIEAVIRNSDDNSQALHMMIPWHKGWDIKLDGKLIVPEKYKNAMMMIYVPPGNHILTMQFKPPYFKEGIWISLIALCILVMIEVFIKRKTREKMLVGN